MCYATFMQTNYMYTTNPLRLWRKHVANEVPYHLLKKWHSIKRDVMREILSAKFEQCPKFKEALLTSEGKRLIEATQDLF